MNKYKFEVKDLIQITIEANSVEEARSEIIDKLHNEEFTFCGDYYVSDGELVKE